MSGCTFYRVGTLAAVFHKSFPQGCGKPFDSRFYAVEYRRIVQKNSLQSLVIHGKMGFSVEKYVGNVDNFSVGQPVENPKNRKISVRRNRFMKAAASAKHYI